MRCDNSDGPIVTADLNENSSARFQRWQIQQIDCAYRRSFSNEDGIPMPAKATAVVFQANRFQRGLTIHKIVHECRRPAPKTAIRLLQRDDVRIEFIDHSHDTSRIPAPVKTDTFPNVVARDPHGRFISFHHPSQMVITFKDRKGRALHHCQSALH